MYVACLISRFWEISMDGRMDRWMVHTSPVDTHRQSDRQTHRKTRWKQYEFSLSRLRSLRHVDFRPIRTKINSGLSLIFYPLSTYTRRFFLLSQYKQTDTIKDTTLPAVSGAGLKGLSSHRVSKGRVWQRIHASEVSDRSELNLKHDTKRLPTHCIVTGPCKQVTLVQSYTRRCVKV